MFFFFFQAEDGIRDYKVTGVQTRALPISPLIPPFLPAIRSRLIIRKLEESDYAREETERCGSTNRAWQNKWLEPGEWQAAPRIPVQGFCGRLRQYDASSLGRRVHEPPSRVVQRFEQIGHRLEP